MIKLINAEAWDWMNNCEDQYDMIFMDPPDNIGLDYGEGINDKRRQYYSWLWGIIFEALSMSKVVWISYYHKHDLEIKKMVARLLKQYKPSWEARTFIWRFTFGQYRETDCGSGYRPILRLSSPGVNWNCNGIRVMSKRMEIGDKRAAGLRVPDDVWEFPRIVGNSKERRSWCPTQHPEALLIRIVRISLGIMPNVTSNKVLELFTGAGTMIRVVKRLNKINFDIDLDTVELSSEYCKKLRAEHPEIKP